MPIINGATDKQNLPVNAQNVTETVDQNQTVWLYETYVGKCVYQYEVNGYDDSDFFMVVYDDATDSFKHQLFATTRGYVIGGFGSSADATPEVKARYNQWVEEQRQAKRKEVRNARAIERLKLKRDISKLCKEYDLPYSKMIALRHSNSIDAIVGLFGSRIRNKFKLNLRNQVITWATSDSQYMSPLSPRQLACI